LRHGADSELVDAICLGLLTIGNVLVLNWIFNFFFRTFCLCLWILWKSSNFSIAFLTHLFYLLVQVDTFLVFNDDDLVVVDVVVGGCDRDNRDLPGGQQRLLDDSFLYECKWFCRINVVAFLQLGFEFLIEGDE